jgi:anti-sigma-K factor RskA
MSNEELQDQYELFVLGVADAEARQDIEQRLSAGDAEVEAGVALAREIVAGLSLVAPQLEPPAHLRQRVMSAVRPETRTFGGWLWAWTAATALLAVLTLNFWQREQTKARELAEARRELAATGARLETVAQLLQFLEEPQVRIASFGRQLPAPPRGKLLVSPNRGVLLLVNNLPPAAEGRVFQMWLVPKSGGPVPAGTFQTSADGRALHVNTQSVNFDTTAAVALSVEPVGGSAAPTTTPFLAVPVPAAE